MKYSIAFSVVFLALASSACEKATVETPAAVALPAPGPAGGTGLTGSIKAPITATDMPTGSQSKPNPQGSMSKQEESMTMPKPGQANDHSSTALHPAR